MGADGDLPLFSRHASGLEIVAQRIRVRLGTHRGDWPLDTSAGIPWTSYLGQTPVDLSGLAALVALEIRAVPGVTQVTDLEWAQNGDAASITCTALTSVGASLPVVVTPPGRAGNLSIVVGGVLGHAETILP
jgi:hypothetical protein